jgi:hypothetical protein
MLFKTTKEKRVFNSSPENILHQIIQIVTHPNVKRMAEPDFHDSKGRRFVDGEFVHTDGHGEHIFQSHLPDDGKRVYVFIQSESHQTQWGTLVECSVSNDEVYNLYLTANDFSRAMGKILKSEKIEFLYDESWRHLALLLGSAADAHHASWLLSVHGYEIVSGVRVNWPDDIEDDVEV